MAAGLRTDLLRHDEALAALVDEVFGADQDPLAAVVRRARSVLREAEPIVWEADPLTFRFTFVSDNAARLLGWPLAQWQAPEFWVRQVVHPDDAEDALAHCAIATARGDNHDFEYRARRADGTVVRVHDVVHVLKGPLGFTAGLRGLMVPVAGWSTQQDEAPLRLAG